MARELDLSVLRDAVRTEVIDATNSYGLVFKFVRPIYNQRQLHEAYPLIVQSLFRALWGHVLMTVCRLLDPKEDDRLASVSTFLRRVRQEQGSESDGSPAIREARRAFHASIEERLRTIEAGWPDLAVRRSAYLAHRDLTKHPPDIVPVEIRRRIEFAQEVLGPVTK